MMEAIQALFANKLIVDDRKPILTFRTSSIPILNNILAGDSGEWELLAPNVELWNQLLLLLVIETLFQVTCAAFIYVTIVKLRGKYISYMIGWFIVIPLALLFPYWLLDILLVDSVVIKMAFVTPALIVFFRCIEAMYGTSPHTVESTIGTYCVYYSSVLHFDWDIKTSKRQRITPSELGQSAMNVLQLCLMLSIVTSFMIETNFRPFNTSKVEATDYHLHSFHDLLSPSHIGNSYMGAILVYLTLSFGFALTALGDEAKGLVRTKPVFFNPLFTSSSPSDFWGRKWNLMIHRVLKHGAFLPARKLSQSKHFAILVTYVMSGLLHEYTNMVMFYHRKELRNTESGICENCYQYTCGKLLAFFLWNGIVMLLEKPVATYVFHYGRPQLPLAIHSTLVILTALPVAHWYYGDWIAAKYFHQISIGLWRLRRKIS